MVNKKIDDNIYFGDFPKHGGGGSGGGEMLEVRVAKLESNVEDIKANLSEARVDIRDLRNTSSGTSRDVCYQRCKTDPPQRLKIDPGVNLLL
ncbi:TPA: hypothetical protein ACGD1P_003388 [Salmonella enterica]